LGCVTAVCKHLFSAMSKDIFNIVQSLIGPD